MAHFDVGDRVSVKAAKRTVRGTVALRQGRLYVVHTDDRRQLRVDSRLLRGAPKEHALVLECALDSGRSGMDPRKQQRSHEYFSELFRALDVDPLHERIHHRDSLRHFIRGFGRHSTIRYVYISSHGASIAGADVILLTHDPIFHERDRRQLRFSDYERGFADKLKKDSEFLRSTFEDALPGKILVLSACDLGKRRGIAELISEVSGAAAVFAYAGIITLDDAFVAEALLFRALRDITKKNTPERIARNVRKALLAAGLDVPLVAYRDGVLSE